MLSLWKGKQTVHVQVHVKAKVDMPLWPTLGESVYMAKGLDDDEEDQLMQANPHLVGLFEIDVTSMVQKHNSTIETRNLTTDANQSPTANTKAQSKAQRVKQEMQAWATNKLAQSA